MGVRPHVFFNAKEIDPNSIQCPLCSCVMVEPVRCPVCSSVFCDICIKQYLFESNYTCPVDGELLTESKLQNNLDHQVLTQL
jgi:hypothetical protein